MNVDSEAADRARRILFVTGDTVGARLAGTAIRCLELARALSEAGFSPTVAAPALLGDVAPQPFPVREFDRARAAATLGPLLGNAHAVVLPLHALVEFPFLARLPIPLVFDLYDPIAFELLRVTSSQPLRARRRSLRVHAAILRQVLARGDFFLCASERQRDLWLGALLAVGRLLPSPDGDPCFRKLIDVVPFGLPSEPPQISSATPRLKSAHSGIAGNDAIIVWGGGLWDWLDPLTPIRAVERLAQRRAGVHLVFLGTAHPTLGRFEGSAATRARALARDSGLEGRCVHFIEGWIPYRDRGEYLLECSAGITTHVNHLESRFAFRTRVLDYLWAGLPVVCTEGDVLADFVKSEGLGIVVPPEEPDVLASAIETILTDADFAAACRERIAAIRPGLAWSAAVAPLARFCATPCRTAAKRGLRATMEEAWQLAASATRVLATQGVGEVARRIHRHILLRP
jgi:glycosyltransferase involved in cell wall biosynthesis